MARMLRSVRYGIATPTYGYEYKRNPRVWEERQWRKLEDDMTEPTEQNQSALSFDDVKNAFENAASKVLDKAIERVREAVKDDPEAQAILDKVISVLEGLKA